MQKHNGTKIQITPRSGQGVSVAASPKKGHSFFSFFGPKKNGAPGGAAVINLKAPPLKKIQPSLPRADLNAVKNWVALEEKIVHDYKEHKRALPKPPPLAAKIPGKPFLPAFETFSTQTTVSVAGGLPRIKDAARIQKKAPLSLGGFLSALAWIAACVLVFVAVQGILPHWDASRQLTQLQNEKQQLEQSYSELKAASANQAAEMRWMQSQFRDIAVKLKTAQDEKTASSQALEKRYREELMRLTLQYENQLDVLRADVRTRDAIVGALKAQAQAFEKVLDPARMAAVSGVAAGFSRQPFVGVGSSAPQGRILSVNGRQGFVVINLGGEQGAHSGRWVVISRDGTGLTAGRIDRVYPSMASVLIRDAGVLPMLQEGDTVSFS